MTSILLSRQCKSCKHYLEDGGWNDYKPYCKAFPKGIPESIQLEKRDHTRKYKGDNGIRFEPIEEEEKKPNA